jgi:hypothetical protein
VPGRRRDAICWWRVRRPEAAPRGRRRELGHTTSGSPRTTIQIHRPADRS